MPKKIHDQATFRPNCTANKVSGVDASLNPPCFHTSQTATLRIHLVYHTVYVDRKRQLQAGPPPEKWPRRLRTRFRKGELVNAIKVDRKYQRFLERPKVIGYRDAAKKFGVSKTIVSLHMAVVTRLQAEPSVHSECISTPGRRPAAASSGNVRVGGNSLGLVIGRGHVSSSGGSYVCRTLGASRPSWSIVLAQQ